MALSENSKKVYEYVKEMDGENITAADIADALGLSTKSVNGIVTLAFQKKGLMVRVPAQIQINDADGTKYKDVKFIKLTEAGKDFDHNAVVEK